VTGADGLSGPNDRGVTIEWYEGPRRALRELFELAEDSPQQLDRYIEDGRVLVARDSAGEIVGHLQLMAGTRAGVFEIKNLAVRPDRQGRGIGRRLVAHALDVCRREGAAAVEVATAVADIDNVRFYQRCGFRAASIERDTFTEAQGYPRDLVAEGIPVRDGIRFDVSFGTPSTGAHDGAP
jgi:GNAT superfamily N-acetyltransferase